MPPKEHEWIRLDPATKQVWRVKGLLLIVVLWLFIGLPTLAGWYYTSPSDPERNAPLYVFIGATVCLPLAFVLYNIWVSLYYNSYRYALGNEGLLINRGVWWKYKRTVPYARIQHISIDQGPIEQMFGVYRVNSYTAGTGSTGGASARSRVTGPEGQILGVREPEPLRNDILNRVMQSRAGDGVSDIRNAGSSNDILMELKAIRKALEKK